MSDSSVRDVGERLATLEERTKPKKKTFMENLQAYGGLIALVITIGYSWPLGVWDRFIIDPQKEEQHKLSVIRESLTRAAELTVEAGRVQSSIANPELRDLAIRSISNQVLLLISNHNAAYEENKSQLFPEELLMIGLMYQNMFRIADSLKYFTYASAHQKASELVKLEASRQIAKSHFVPSPVQDVQKAREMFAELVEKTKGTNRIEVAAHSITIQSEWGYFEMTAGDWKCGDENFLEAMNRLAQWQPMINDQGNMMRLLQSKYASLSIKPGQENNGC